MVKTIRYSAVLVLLFMLGACAIPKPPIPCDAGNPLKRIAVLPMRNDTTDVEGPDMVRAKMVAELADHSYVVQDLKETDQILRDQMGINLGGQLDMTTAQKLGETLGVQGVLYGTLMDFDEVTTGIINVKKVRAKFKLVNTATGQSLWARGLGVRSEERMGGAAGSAGALLSRAADKDKDVPWVTIESTSNGESNVGKSFAIGLGKKLFAKATGKHLAHESEELARRVTYGMPWGPCTMGEAAPAPGPKPTPKIDMPMVKAPEPPSFGHMEFGKRDFSALMVNTTVNKDKHDTMVMEAKIAKAGQKFRSDMDMSKMAQGKGMPPELSRMIVINRGDKKEHYTVYPNKKKYIVQQETEGHVGEEPKIEKTKVGSEEIDGHPTDKYRVRITNKDGKVYEGFMWNAKDLEGMTIKTETENNDYKVTMELKHIVLKRPAASLFEIPEGYVEAKGMIDLMMPDKNKKEE